MFSDINNIVWNWVVNNSFHGGRQERKKEKLLLSTKDVLKINKKQQSFGQPLKISFDVLGHHHARTNDLLKILTYAIMTYG